MQCPNIPELGYGEWSEQFHLQVGEQHVPIVGSLELTFRCNLRCVHCYAGHGHSGIPGQKELTPAEIGRILGEVADEGCLWLLLTGGEPLLRPDFQDIYTDAKRRGLLVTLFTNGTLVTPRLADFLVEWRPFAIEITLYGRSQETYERVTGVPGSHARCMRAIELLLERELPLKLKTMLLTINRHELGDMRAFAESLGTRFGIDPVVNPGLDGSSAPIAYRLPVDKIVEFERSDPRRVEAWGKSFGSRFGLRPDTQDLYMCGAGLQGFHIDPYGRLSLCILAREPSYDLRDGSFAEGWREFLPQVRGRQCSTEYECRNCDLRMLCGQCPGWAMLRNGDPEARVEFECQLAHARAEAFLPGL